MRSGFTLVETLVALVLVQFGLLAVAAASVIAARELAAATRATRARDVARERVEALRAGACSTPGAGTHATPSLVEHWSVISAGGVRIIRDSVDYALPAGRRGRLVLEHVVLCE